MPAPELREMTWEEVRDLDRGRLVAVLPVGAIEAHGPHLPLDADVVIAEAMAADGCAKLRAGGYGVVVLPPLAYTAAPFAEGFPGTISIPAELITEQVVAIARSLASQGFDGLAIANAHLDPAHLAALHAAVERIESEGLLAVSFPDLTRKPWALRLGDEFLSGACHAGRYETSIVLAARPDSVREPLRVGLAANPASLSTAIRGGLATFEEAGGPLAYFGDPAQATPDEGAATIAVLGSILHEAAQAAFPAPGDGAPSS